MDCCHKEIGKWRKKLEELVGYYLEENTDARTIETNQADGGFKAYLAQRTKTRVRRTFQRCSTEPLRKGERASRSKPKDGVSTIFQYLDNIEHCTRMFLRSAKTPLTDVFLEYFCRETEEYIGEIYDVFVGALKYRSYFDTPDKPVKKPVTKMNKESKAVDPYFRAQFELMMLSFRPMDEHEIKLSVPSAPMSTETARLHKESSSTIVSESSKPQVDNKLLKKRHNADNVDEVPIKMAKQSEAWSAAIKQSAKIQAPEQTVFDGKGANAKNVKKENPRKIGSSKSVPTGNPNNVSSEIPSKAVVNVGDKIISPPSKKIPVGKQLQQISDSKKAPKIPASVNKRHTDVQNDKVKPAAKVVMIPSFQHMLRNERINSAILPAEQPCADKTVYSMPLLEEPSTKAIVLTTNSTKADARVYTAKHKNRPSSRIVKGSKIHPIRKPLTDVNNIVEKTIKSPTSLEHPKCHQHGGKVFSLPKTMPYRIPKRTLVPTNDKKRPEKEQPIPVDVNGNFLTPKRSLKETWKVNATSTPKTPSVHSNVAESQKTCVNAGLAAGQLYYYCTYCQRARKHRTFNNEEAVRVHCAAAHYTEEFRFGMSETAKCFQCEHSGTFTQLIDHFKRCHSIDSFAIVNGIKQTACAICTKSSSPKHFQSDHKDIVNTTVDPIRISCTNLSKMPINRNDKMQFVCLLCKVFFSRGDILNHLLGHGIACSDCSFCTTDGVEWLMHKRSHDNFDLEECLKILGVKLKKDFFEMEVSYGNGLNLYNHNLYGTGAFDFFFEFNDDLLDWKRLLELELQQEIQKSTAKHSDEGKRTGTDKAVQLNDGNQRCPNQLILEDDKSNKKSLAGQLIYFCLFCQEKGSAKPFSTERNVRDHWSEEHPHVRFRYRVLRFDSSTGNKLQQQEDIEKQIFKLEIPYVPGEDIKKMFFYWRREVGAQIRAGDVTKVERNKKINTIMVECRSKEVKNYIRKCASGKTISMSDLVDKPSIYSTPFSKIMHFDE